MRGNDQHVSTTTLARTACAAGPGSWPGSSGRPPATSSPSRGPSTVPSMPGSIVWQRIVDLLALSDHQEITLQYWWNRKKTDFGGKTFGI